MIRQYIEIGDAKWNVIVYYNIEDADVEYISDELAYYGCPRRDIFKAMRMITVGWNAAMTFSNSDYEISVICIGKTTSREQFINSVVHEAKHVQSHICDYYNVKEDGEPAAYLIGHIVQNMYRLFSKIKT